MQPQVAVRPHLVDPQVDGLVLAVLATGQEQLRAALRRVAAEPALVGVLTRVVVLDAGRTPSATVLREAVRLPEERLRVVRQPGATRPEAVARLLVEAADERSASAVLVLDDVALTEPAALLEAFRVARASSASDVVGLRDAAASEPGPVSWWGAVLPLDAVRALGATLPEAGEVALAELVLRAEAAGFRPSVVVEFVDAPVPDTTEIMVIPSAGLPLRLRRDGVDYALTEGHMGDPVRYDYSSAAAEEAQPPRRRRRG